MIMVEGLFLVNKVIAVLGEFSAVPWRARSAPSVTVAILGVVSIWKPKSKVFQFLFWSILNFRDTCASNMVTLFFKAVFGCAEVGTPRTSKAWTRLSQTAAAGGCNARLKGHAFPNWNQCPSKAPGCLQFTGYYWLISLDDG